MTYDLGANFTSAQPCDACTTSSGASGSSWPCAFRLALCGLDVSRDGDNPNDENENLT
jgi:hypothetical protein